MPSYGYGYSEKVADVIRPLGQGTVRKPLGGFRSIPDVSIESSATQNQINARNVRTGNLRGNQQIRGQIQIQDSNGRKVMVMGYGKGMF